MTGMRLWMGAITALGVVVIIATADAQPLQNVSSPACDAAEFAQVAEVFASVHGKCRDEDRVQRAASQRPKAARKLAELS